MRAFTCLVLFGACLCSLAPSSRRPVASQEHVVERRPRHRDRADLDLGRDPGGGRSRRSSRRRPRRTAPAHRARRPPARARAARRARTRCAPRRRRRSETETTSWPISALSCSGVPSATILPSSMIATRSQSLSASSRYWVVRKTVVPVGVDPPHLVPDGQPRGRIEAGRRLVEEQHARASGPARWPGPAGASSRRSRSSFAARRPRSARPARAAPGARSRPRRR